MGLGLVIGKMGRYAKKEIIRKGKRTEFLGSTIAKGACC